VLAESASWCLFDLEGATQPGQRAGDRSGLNLERSARAACAFMALRSVVRVSGAGVVAIHVNVTIDQAGRHHVLRRVKIELERLVHERNGWRAAQDGLALAAKGGDNGNGVSGGPVAPELICHSPAPPGGRVQN
jgi:hypothetical protein